MRDPWRHGCVGVWLTLGFLEEKESKDKFMCTLPSMHNEAGSGQMLSDWIGSILPEHLQHQEKVQVHLVQQRLRDELSSLSLWDVGCRWSQLHRGKQRLTLSQSPSQHLYCLLCGMECSLCGVECSTFLGLTWWRTRPPPSLEDKRAKQEAYPSSEESESVDCTPFAINSCFLWIGSWWVARSVQNSVICGSLWKMEACFSIHTLLLGCYNRML